MTLLAANGEVCGACGSIADTVTYAGPGDPFGDGPLKPGDLLYCGACGAEHELVADGLRYTGGRDPAWTPHTAWWRMLGAGDL